MRRNELVRIAGEIEDQQLGVVFVHHVAIIDHRVVSSRVGSQESSTSLHRAAQSIVQTLQQTPGVLENNASHPESRRRQDVLWSVIDKQGFLRYRLSGSQNMPVEARTRLSCPDSAGRERVVKQRPELRAP